MEEWKPKDLKNKSFTNIQDLFDKAMKRVNTFVDMDTELVKDSSKKAKAEIAQESNSKRAGEALRSKRWMMIKKLKSLSNIYKEGKKSYFQIIRANGNSQMYLTFGKMLQNFDREDLEVLWSIVKPRFKKTELVNYMDIFLHLNLTTMFEHHLEDSVWKNQQGLVKGRIVGIKGLLEVTTAKGSIISSAKERASGEAPRSLTQLLRSLSSSEARGSVFRWTSLCIGIFPYCSPTGIYTNEHFEVLCVQHQRLCFNREIWFVTLLSFVFPFFLFIMSKRNLGSVTQSEFLGFIEEYGIAMCYDHQLPSTKQTALDAPEGYIPFLGTFSFSYLIKPIDEVLHDHLNRHPFEAQTFLRPILYLMRLAISFRNFMKRPGQVPTFFARPADQPVDAGSPSMDHSKAADDNDQGKKLSIIAALEEGTTIVRNSVVHSSSRDEAKKHKHEGPKRTSSRGSVHPLPVFTPKGVGKHPRVLARHLGAPEPNPDPFVHGN
ncbi:hypothetical protein Tco_0393579 [Tanacetum coccineum]